MSPVEQVVTEVPLLPAWMSTAIVTLAPGAVGGAANVLTGHPIDLVKVRLQTSTTAGDTTFGLLRHIARTSGLPGLYAGVSAPLVAVIPAFAVTFGSYEWGKSALLAREGSREPGAQLGLSGIAMAGGFSGMFVGVVLGPFERIKCLLQVRGGGNFMDVVRECYGRGGIASVGRGTPLTIARDVPGNAAYFATFEFLHRGISSSPSFESSPSWVITLLAGGFAGITNWIVAIPIDVIKSRWQTNDEYKSVTSCVRHLISKEGFGALFRGLAPALLRAFPANAATFLGVAFAKSGIEYTGFFPSNYE